MLCLVCYNFVSQHIIKIIDQNIKQEERRNVKITKMMKAKCLETTFCG